MTFGSDVCSFFPTRRPDQLTRSLTHLDSILRFKGFCSLPRLSNTEMREKIVKQEVFDAQYLLFVFFRVTYVEMEPLQTDLASRSLDCPRESGFVHVLRYTQRNHRATALWLPIEQNIASLVHPRQTFSLHAHFES